MSDEARTSPVAVFLASVIARAGEAPDARIDRLALIAGDLLAKIKSARDTVAWARAMGFDGPVGGIAEPQHGIANDVLGRAQKSLDSDRPDYAAVAAGIGAARRLIAVETGPDRSRLDLWMARTILGPSGGFAPPELSRDDGGPSGETETNP